MHDVFRVAIDAIVGSQPRQSGWLVFAHDLQQVPPASDREGLTFLCNRIQKAIDVASKLRCRDRHDYLQYSYVRIVDYWTYVVNSSMIGLFASLSPTYGRAVNVYASVFGFPSSSSMSTIRLRIVSRWNACEGPSFMDCDSLKTM